MSRAPGAYQVAGICPPVSELCTPTHVFEQVEAQYTTGQHRLFHGKICEIVDEARASTIDQDVPNRTSRRFNNRLQIAWQTHMDVFTAAEGMLSANTSELARMLVRNAFTRQLSEFDRLVSTVGKDELDIDRALGTYAMLEWLHLSTVYDPSPGDARARQKKMGKHSPFAVASSTALVLGINQKIPVDQRAEQQRYVITGIVKPGMIVRTLLAGGYFAEKAEEFKVEPNQPDK